MSSFSVIIYLTFLVFCCGSCFSWSSTVQTTESNTALTSAEGPSLADIYKIIDSYDLSNLINSYGNPENETATFEGRKKKPKPGKMMMMMGATAAMSMMMMKAGAIIKLFIIHSFLAKKLVVIIAAYLLLCKMMEMKQTKPQKSTIKWIASPPSHDEPPMHMMHHPVQEPSYEPHQEQQAPQPADQYGPPQLSDQYGPPQQFMPSGMSDYGASSSGGGGDLQGHYSHISPVTYRPGINRNQQDKKNIGRRRK
ncbi:uncharacterized protein LOC126901443 [Daktulosphaira vitifoliae]|uniref:uncharacterized protein LOC126901443 n=1 Tax=Daktulosphaira vitifoliae TaxID=58002 RepID=UPI0021AA1A02|nr:uncharacterized protein LOC126901443 [Daktulosphaira vitifoliae]